jgi:GxxExxY protein
LTHKSKPDYNNQELGATKERKKNHEGAEGAQRKDIKPYSPLRASANRRFDAPLWFFIFVGEEIYYTGQLHTPIRKLEYNFSVVVNFPEQAQPKVRRGMDPALQSESTKERKMITKEQERLAKNVLNCAYEVHSFLGPGLLESAYQTCLQYELTQQGIFVECEKSIPVVYKGIALDCGYRIDMMAGHGQLLIENKAVKEINDVHLAQILTYLKLSGISLGFLFNFNVQHFKTGIRRVVL